MRYVPWGVVCFFFPTDTSYRRPVLPPTRSSVMLFFVLTACVPSTAELLASSAKRRERARAEKSFMPSFLCRFSAAVLLAARHQLRPRLRSLGHVPPRLSFVHEHAFAEGADEVAVAVEGVGDDGGDPGV